MKRKRGAQRQRFKLIKIGGFLNTRERAALPCGCCIFVGVKSDGQVATATQACAEEHQVLVTTAGEILTTLTMTPRQRPMVATCIEALNEAVNALGW